MDTLFIGKNIIFLPETGSTNSYATDMLKNVNLAEGTVVHTANQTNGKGQRGNTWVVEPASNVTASVILKPSFLDIKKQFLLYQVVALACYDTMAELLDPGQFDIKIKWPNDILVNKQKIAGILLENTILNNQISACVAGVGINVNQVLFAEGIRATSLAVLTHDLFKIDHVLKLLCQYLEKYYLALKNDKIDFIQENYFSHLFGLNTWLDFEVKGEVESLFVKGITQQGLLLLEEKNGSFIEADVKDVKWIY